jgi:hypothetical protein
LLKHFMPLTPSEMIFLCGDRFADGERAQDSSREQVLTSARRVNAERLAVAAIRAAVLANQRQGAITLSWEHGEDLAGTVELLATVGGPAGRLLKKVHALPAVQRAVSRPSPRLQRGACVAAWPDGTVEKRLASFDSSQAIGLCEHVQTHLGGGQRACGASVMRVIKAALVQRGLLETSPRAFGLLQPGHRLPERVRVQALAQSAAVAHELQAWQQEQPQVWADLERSTTIALRTGIE